MALLRSQLGQWQQRYRLQRIGLFGSTARNEATASNDLVRLLVNPALWNTEERNDREPCTKSCTNASSKPRPDLGFEDGAKRTRTADPLHAMKQDAGLRVILLQRSWVIVALCFE